MSVIPDITWKRLSVEDLKNFYEHDPKEYNREETAVVVALVHLVEQEKVRAFLKSDGNIYYQYDFMQEYQ